MRLELLCFFEMNTGSSTAARVCSNPAEAMVHERELIAVDELQLHVNFVAVHRAIQGQLVPCVVLKSEVGLRVSVSELGERNCPASCVDAGIVAVERIVHPLKDHTRDFENRAPPALVVGEQWCTKMAVDR